MSYDGSVIINNAIRINPRFTLSDFKKTDLYSHQDTSRFFWVREKCSVDGYIFIVGFWFEGEFLRQVQLFCDEDYIKSEKQRKQVHDEFLKALTGKNDFIWGSIESTIDSKNLESVIVINYNK